MGILERAQAGVKRMMMRFPSEIAYLYRAEADKYGQPTGEWREIAMVRIWKNAVNRPSKWVREESGVKYDDNGMQWVTLLYEDAPEAKHGDKLVYADGSARIIRNIQANSAGTRIFWQVSEV